MCGILQGTTTRSVDPSEGTALAEPPVGGCTIARRPPPTEKHGGVRASLAFASPSSEQQAATHATQPNVVDDVVCVG